MNTDRQLRRQLIKQIEGGQAFVKIESLLQEIPFEQLGVRPEDLPYSFYELFFHMRVAQYDILDFSTNPGYQAPAWPDDYWPLTASPENQDEWEQLKAGFFSERKKFCDFISDADIDLFTPLPQGDGQTLLREAMLILEHNAYHTGQLAVLLRLLHNGE